MFIARRLLRGSFRASLVALSEHRCGVSRRVAMERLGHLVRRHEYSLSYEGVQGRLVMNSRLSEPLGNGEQMAVGRG